MVVATTEMIAEAEPYFVFCYSKYAADKCAPKSEISSYNDLLDAIKHTGKLGEENIIDFLRPYKEGTGKVDPNAKITAENGNDWVEYCKGNVGHTWFKVVCFKVSVAEAANHYTDDTDYTGADANSDSDIEPTVKNTINDSDADSISEIIDCYAHKDSVAEIVDHYAD